MKVLAEIFSNTFNSKSDFEVTDEKKQLMEVSESIKKKYGLGLVDKDLDQHLKKNLTEFGLKPISIGQCDPYRHQNSDTIYTDNLECGDIIIYIVYRKEVNTGDRLVTSISFTCKGKRFYPSLETIEQLAEEYENIKEYDRSFLG